MENKKNTTGRDLMVFTLGFVVIALGGLAHLLNEWLFWYPLGLITVPFIASWIRLTTQIMKNKKAKSIKQ